MRSHDQYVGDGWLRRWLGLELISPADPLGLDPRDAAGKQDAVPGRVVTIWTTPDCRVPGAADDYVPQDVDAIEALAGEA